MKLRCNYISYLSAIDNFGQLYIIQQGGRGITREQIINRLKNVFEGLSRKKALECFSQNINSSNYEMFNSILITK